MNISWLPVKTVGRILNTSIFCQDFYKLFQCFSFLQLMCYKLLMTRERVKIAWLCLCVAQRRQLQNTTLSQIKETLNVKLLVFLWQHTKAYLMLQIPLCWMSYRVEKRQFFEEDLRETVVQISPSKGGEPGLAMCRPDSLSGSPASRMIYPS